MLPFWPGQSESWKRGWRNTPASVWGGTVAGYYHLIPGAEKTELDDFYILPPYRGRGIGTRALKDCIQRAAGPLFLYVFSRNAGAIRLYERMGFQITETVGETRCIMERN